jgi:hypothetical protein
MGLDASFRLVIERLKYNRKFSKYQFERSLDAFLSLFIEEYLSSIHQSEVIYVAAEFPLKKQENNQSTNIDYLLLRKGLSPAWIFVELKTDKNSQSDKQLKTLDTLKNKPFRPLFEDIQHILSNTKRKDKYNYLLSTIRSKCNSEKDFDLLIHPICLSIPEPTLTIKNACPAIDWILLSQFDKQLSNTKHPELWSLVRTFFE